MLRLVTPCSYVPFGTFPWDTLFVKRGTTLRFGKGKKVTKVGEGSGEAGGNLEEMAIKELKLSPGDIDWPPKGK